MFFFYLVSQAVEQSQVGLLQRKVVVPSHFSVNHISQVCLYSFKI